MVPTSKVYRLIPGRMVINLLNLLARGAHRMMRKKYVGRPLFRILSITALALLIDHGFSQSAAIGQPSSEDDATDLDSWVVFHTVPLDGSNRTSASDTFGIRRSQIGTGGQYFCGGPHRCTDDVWVRGYHRDNPTVRYRMSLTRYAIRCGGWVYGKDQFLTYDANGKVLSQWERTDKLRAIVPGSIEELVARKFCKYPR